MITQLKKELAQLANPEKAAVLQRFFKTGKGEYGDGDRFLGIPVPDQRRVAKKYQDISLKEIKKLISSSYHEHRLTSLLILVMKYTKSDDSVKKEIVNLYLENMEYVNSWDLVDLSAEKILGDYLLERDKSILYDFAVSENLWKRRIAIMATFRFIKNNLFKDTIKISVLLLNDEHDLIHKAVGWMLRETGKKNITVEEAFLKKYYKQMPRTMLRYAIEKFDARKRSTYLNNLV